MKKIKGFTLIELLIVVAIIGIIAAIAIPNLLSAIQRGKQKRAMGEIRSIATSAQAYSTDQEAFPKVAAVAITGTDAASTLLAPDYMQKMPTQDAWKHTYYYAADTTGSEFTVTAYGKLSTADPSWTAGSTGCFENDILWNNDNFAIKPEGKQKKCG